MTRTSNARIAGVTTFVYLAAGIAEMALARPANTAGVPALLASFSALIMGVTFYALTRDQDRDLAMLALICRAIEAVPGEGYIYFAVGNTIFAWLFLRGRMIPVALAQFGVIAGVLLVVSLLLQRAGLFGGVVNWSSSITWLTSLPMLAFELTLAVWLITKGAATTVRVSHMPALEKI